MCNNVFIIVIKSHCTISINAAREKSDVLWVFFFDGCFLLLILYASIAVVCALVILILRVRRRNSRGNRKRFNKKMKVKVISRIEEEYTRETKSEAIKVHRIDPRLRPMHRATEYKRALNATKLDKVFAKPFCGAFEDIRTGFCPWRRIHRT